MTADKPGNLRCRLDHMEHVIRYVATLITLDLNQHITGIKHSRRLNALIPSHLDHRLGGYENLGYLGLQIGVAHARLQTVAYLLLVSGVGVKYEPLLHE